MKFFLAALGIMALAALITSLRINHQQHEMVVERLGKYVKTWDPGLHLLIPVVDRVVRTVSLKEQIVNIPSQSVICRDNATVMVDVVVFYRVVSSYHFTYGIDRCEAGIENLVATTLRNIIGELELDETLSGRHRRQLREPGAGDRAGLRGRGGRAGLLRCPQRPFLVRHPAGRGPRRRRPGGLRGQRHPARAGRAEDEADGG
ncbi:MAG: SPFH domain-containing protein, partial [Eggerthellales bacterium]|nr:SPFH domain-containing protein [Eggerthellales bacterium]